MISRAAVTYTSLRHTYPPICPIRAKQGLARLAYHSTIQPAIPSLPFVPLAYLSLRVCCDGRPKKGALVPPSPSVTLSETEFTSNRTDLIDVTRDPDLRPAQACLLSWICRVYRPFASCLACLAAGCHSFQPPYARHPPMCGLCPGACLPSWERQSFTSVPASSSFPGDMAVIIGLSTLPHVQTRAAGLFLGRGMQRGVRERLGRI